MASLGVWVAAIDTRLWLEFGLLQKVQEKQFKAQNMNRLYLLLLAVT
jgi:hypothetical protein